MQNDMKLDSNLFLQYKDKFELKKIRVLKKTREWELIISLKGFIPIPELGEIESAIAEYFKLNKVRIIIYESSVSLSADELVKSYWEDLIKAVIASNPSFTGFIMDSNVQLENNVIRITVKSEEAAKYLTAKMQLYY